MATDDLPLLTFSDASAFEAWLANQPEGSPGVWLRIAKQGAPKTSVRKSDAIDCALAHGWIDGQLGRVDGFSFKMRFTQRKPKSAWSRINCERVERLIESGRMTRRGQALVDQAKADGRWGAAYSSQGKGIPDADLLTALDSDPRARRVYDALDSANRYAILYRVHQAKTSEKRAAKIAELVAMLLRGETIHPRRTPRGSRA